MSRKRDGIVVSALSFLPPPPVRELIKELLFMVVRRICGSRSAFTTRPPPQAASPGRGVMPTAYPAHTKVVSSRRAAGAVENHKSEISPEVNAGFLPRKEWKEKAQLSMLPNKLRKYMQEILAFTSGDDVEGMTVLCQNFGGKSGRNEGFLV